MTTLHAAPNVRPDLSGPDLSGPDLSGPDLSGPDLSGPDLSGPDLSGPDLSGPDRDGSDTRRRNASLPAAVRPVPASLPPRALARIARELAGQVELWQPRLRVDPDRRWYTRLSTGDGWEAWLLTWCSGQATDLHDHGGSSGAFTVLSGVLTELTPAPLGNRPARLSSRRLTTGQVRAFGASHIHQVAGVSATPAASLHVYGPALTVMNRYEFDPERGAVLAFTERAGLDW